MEQLFFGFGYILAIIGILIYKKTSKSENFLAWLIISIILMMCYHSMVSCLLMIINMKFDIDYNKIMENKEISELQNQAKLYYCFFCYCYSWIVFSI